MMSPPCVLIRLLLRASTGRSLNAFGVSPSKGRNGPATCDWFKSSLACPAHQQLQVTGFIGSVDRD